jgi:hypothetical protein
MELRENALHADLGGKWIMTRDNLAGLSFFFFIPQLSESF